MRRWADDHPEYLWAPYPPGPPFDLAERVAALDAAVGASEEPVVLIAHSAGCIATVTWAWRHTGPVRGALLVAPPYIDPQWKPGTGEVTDAAFGTVPRVNLPFRTIVVASRTDPSASFAQSEQPFAATAPVLGNHVGGDIAYGPAGTQRRLLPLVVRQVGQQLGQACPLGVDDAPDFLAVHGASLACVVAVRVRASMRTVMSWVGSNSGSG